MTSPLSAGRFGDRCERCGGAVTAGSSFCETCGAPLAVATERGGATSLRPATGGWPQEERAPVHGPMSAASAEERLLPWGPGADPLVGAATPNETYLGHRLSYSDVATNFDPLANPTYQRALLSQFLGIVAAWCIGSVVLFLVFGVAGLAHQLSLVESNPLGALNGSTDTSPLLVIWQVLWSVLSVVLALLFWLRKLSVQLTEWMLTVDDRGHAARPALEHMYTIIAARRTPIRSMKVVHLAPPRQQPREYLQIDDEVFTGFVSSFPYGADLFIGWTFWLNMSPGRWLVLTISRLFGGGGGGLYGSLAYDQPKAMREVLHSAVRQGVDIATGAAQPAGQGMIGRQIPIVTIER